MIRALLASLIATTALTAAPTDPWIRVQSANFELFTTGSERAGRDLARHFEEIRGFFLEVFGVKSSNGKPVRIIAFRSEKEFQPFRPNEAAAAFFHDGSEHDYIVMDSTAPEHYLTATHEYTHLLINQLGGATVPLWLNEGMAELYSTTEQSGDTMLVGNPPPGRGRMLLDERWIPLAALVSIGHNSPLYNEKSHAGMFYAESWALVHMLNLDKQYRARLAVLLDALKTSDSAAAFDKAYGKSLAEVQTDLQEYIGRQTLHGVAFRISISKAAESPEIEWHAARRARLALAEMVADYPGKKAQADALYAQLGSDFPESWEVEAALGRYAWRERHNQDAVRHFARAADLGANNPRMFLDYARALNITGPPENTVAALRKAIALDPSLQEAHYDLGLALARAGAWRDAIAELERARPVKPQQASRYFYGMAYAEFRLGDTIAARNYVEQGRPYTRIPEEVSALDQLSRSLGPPVVEGVLENIECKDKAASLRVRVDGAARIFLIPDLTDARDLTCGSQKDAAVRIEFQAMPANTAGADGIVKSLAFK